MAIYDYSVKDKNDNEISLGEYKGKVLLIVNTASKCGFTSQYEGLEKIYEKYKEQGFEVLAFPCNQFGAQEPGSQEEIQSFCSLNFGTQFPIFKKIDVNGSSATPLYEYLKKEAPGIMGTKAIKWNFTKFLVDKEGKVVKRFAPKDKPEELSADIEKLL
ncbi:MAG: glutathione peroxidase [Halobacteriovoraceae bacterium]|nr:glutathione peroxidase [Halobacteriovoraceae bacterium]MBC96327.1 glutathione peroxidase [Halobacteriovoraceae bacterium]|tara:strand:- start:2618 stop:3094 length:477 start_codon:yes stop_codon:yes gene_type:complete